MLLKKFDDRTFQPIPFFAGSPAAVQIGLAILALRFTGRGVIFEIVSLDA
jgi:hypothetical protein